jgi:hypothetical protein
MGSSFITFWPIPTMYKYFLVMESEIDHLFSFVVINNIKSSIKTYMAYNITLMLNRCLINIFCKMNIDFGIKTQCFGWQPIKWGF